MSEPLDMSKDPDRYDPDREVDPPDPALHPRPDPKLDPDRYGTLPEMLGDGAYEDERDNYQWLIGLLGIALFLAVVTALIYLT